MGHNSFNQVSHVSGKRCRSQWRNSECYGQTVSDDCMHYTHGKVLGNAPVTRSLTKLDSKTTGNASRTPHCSGKSTFICLRSIKAILYMVRSWNSYWLSTEWLAPDKRRDGYFRCLHRGNDGPADSIHARQPPAASGELRPSALPLITRHDIAKCMQNYRQRKGKGKRVSTHNPYR